MALSIDLFDYFNVNYASVLFCMTVLSTSFCCCEFDNIYIKDMDMRNILVHVLDNIHNIR